MQLPYFILLTFLILLCWLWASLAIYVAGPESDPLRYICLSGFILLLPVLYFFVKPAWLSYLGMFIVLAVVYLWWISLRPSNERDWLADVAKTAHGSINGNLLTIHNFRNTDYRSLTDFTPHWETREFDLEKLQSLDLFLSYWGSPHIAHIVLSWGFSDGRFLAVSIETRKARGQRYSELKGFFKEYTLTYIAGDERDLIRLRTNHRKEQVYFYRIKNIPRDYKLELLRIYLAEMNALHLQPKFYHALFKNCTSGISGHFKVISPDSWFMDWRLIANGHLDELLYDLKLIRRDLPFAELKQASRIDLRMQRDDPVNFSQQLREGLINP